MSYVAGLRELLTAYTPYQPERSQGTLMTQWLYQCCLAALTGFEAINASQYDRATALVEALHTATRLVRAPRQHFSSLGPYPQDLAVVQTLLTGTVLTYEVMPLDPVMGTVPVASLQDRARACAATLAGIVFPQANSLGCLEDVDGLTDLAHQGGAKAIVVIDPMLLATGGLKAPGTFGQQGQGGDLLVGEGQHLAIPPHYGGPGLGMFGVRFNAEHRQDIRSAPGRFVGDALDEAGRAPKSWCYRRASSTSGVRKPRRTSAPIKALSPRWRLLVSWDVASLACRKPVSGPVLMPIRRRRRWGDFRGAPGISAYAVL